MITYGTLDFSVNKFDHQKFPIYHPDMIHYCRLGERHRLISLTS